MRHGLMCFSLFVFFPYHDTFKPGMSISHALHVCKQNIKSCEGGGGFESVAFILHQDNNNQGAGGLGNHTGHSIHPPLPPFIHFRSMWQPFAPRLVSGSFMCYT